MTSAHAEKTLHMASACVRSNSSRIQFSLQFIMLVYAKKAISEDPLKLAEEKAHTTLVSDHT